MSSPFQSFVWAGFECTYARVSKTHRFDLLRASQHDTRVEEDYQLIKTLGITTVREGLAWSEIDKGEGVYDFSRFEPLLYAGQQHSIQQIWDLNHFDIIDNVDPLSPELVDRFSRYSEVVIKKLREFISETIYIVPLNEISFFSWIGADQGTWAPFLAGGENGYAFKKQLVRLAIAAMKTIKATDPNVQFIHVDPFMHRFPAPTAPQGIVDYVQSFNKDIRYQSWDMLMGLLEPELGGSPDLVDYIGVNYYLHNQEWIRPNPKKTDGINHKTLSWNSKNRLSLALFLKQIYERYKKPIVITETGSYGHKRERWWDRILREAKEAMESGIPIYGLCAYPVLDRPKGAGFIFPHSGLIDFDMSDPTCARKPFLPALEKIQEFHNHHQLSTFALHQ